MSVKLKMNKSQLGGLHLLLRDGMERNPPENVADSLLHDLMDKLAERLRARIRKLDTDCKYLTLTYVEAKAFYCWYQNVKTDMEPQYSYEVIVCDGIYNDIDRACMPGPLPTRD